MATFEEEYQKLSSNERNQFATVVSDLLYDVYIVRKVYDRKSQMFVINPDYLYLERNFSLVETYLGFLDITLSKSDDDGVIFILSGGDFNHLRLDTVTTLVVYALRSFYEGQVAKAPEQNDVLMTSGALNSYLSEMGLSNITKRLSATSVSSSLRTLDSFNVVSKASGTYGDPSYSFFILPPIRYVISNDKMNALYNFLAGQNGADKDSNDLFQAPAPANAAATPAPETPAPTGAPTADHPADDNLNPVFPVEDSQGENK
ncbi:MAG: DUF4194 domain-containing protein [Bacilli bacterium]|jgi:hypothetical protein|nr:DUF4194 domain-containing protein [Bacilli bacterium]